MALFRIFGRFWIACWMGLALISPLSAKAWTLEEAAEPYRGTVVDVVFLSRPGYAAMQAMIPEFEARTGIEVNTWFYNYETALAQQVRDFVTEQTIDVALVDLVWIGTFVEGDWLSPIDRFLADPALADPAINLDDFFPLLLSAFGRWDDVQYGLPFDNYSGLLYYNKCQLLDAGFDRPPQSWQELRDVYGPALTRDGRYAFALQSSRNETQAADSFARFLWPFGGSFLTGDFHANLTSEASRAGLAFRQSLTPYMPDGITAYDHLDVVNAFVRGDVAMITEWSAFYPIMAESGIQSCLGIAPEPEGPAGRLPALGGFSLAVTTQGNSTEQAAAWLFIQWATSREASMEYLERGGIPARQSIYQTPGLSDRFPFVEALVKSWQAGVPEFRPRFSEWTIISPLVQQWGADMQDGLVSVEDGTRELAQEIERVLAAAGYHDGRKAIAQ